MIAIQQPLLTIMLSNSQVALIDEADWERPLSTEFADGYVWTGRPCDVTWRGHRKPHTIYVVSTLHRCGHDRELRLNRVIVEARASQLVDHRDGDGLNNMRFNLRIADAAGNARNRSPNKGKRFKGISFNKGTGKWEVSIKKNRKKTYLGLYADPVDAALAYDRAALALFGEFARLNFPIELSSRAAIVGDTVDAHPRRTKAEPVAVGAATSKRDALLERI